MKIFNKLVRDKIPAIITANGDVATFHTIQDDEEYLRELLRKDIEESEELARDLNLGELADKLEVLYAIAKTLGYTPEEVEKARADKAEAGGGFDARVFLESTN